MRALHIVSCSLTLAAAAAAQDLLPKAPSQRGPIAITNATLHTIDRGDVANGTIWFDGGVIRGVEGAADATTVPANAERIDGTGLHVWPGLFGANTSIGLQEIAAVRATLDADEIGDTTPEVRAAVAVNPDSTAIPVTRANGVLVVAVVPEGGLVPGRASVVQLEGWTWEDMAIDADCGTVVQWPALPAPVAKPDEKVLEAVLEKRRAIDALFREARAELAARDAESTRGSDVRAAALAPVLRRENPVLLGADSLEQIQSAVTWAADLGLRAVIVGGRDAPLCADLLRAHDVAVIVTGTFRLPKRRDSDYDAPFRLPADLQAAGLRFCLASSGPFYNERNLPYEAATAVAHGLDRAAALRAITLSPAEILGVGDRVGSLTPGKLATLIVTDGDPLEVTTVLRAAYVSGRRIDLRSKQTELAAKYREKYRQLGILPRDE